MVIKVVNKYLCAASLGLIDGTLQAVTENVLSEQNILKHLTNDDQSDCITKFNGFFATNLDWILLMEDGGRCLFDFCVEIHQLIQAGKCEISEWMKLVKIIFKKMVESVQYLHSKNVCHFDISLENFLINGLKIKL